MTIDLGTGDGRAVLATAASEPTSLVIGLDAADAAMAESSRRATRARTSNALFVVASAEAIPAELIGIADRVTVRFPWGSLLRGCVGLDETVTAGIAALVAPGGTLELLLAPIARDGLAGVPTEPGDVLHAAAVAFGAHGFELIEGRPASAAEIAASCSTWAKRLGSVGNRSAVRPVMLVRLRSSAR